MRTINWRYRQLAANGRLGEWFQNLVLGDSTAEFAAPKEACYRTGDDGCTCDGRRQGYNPWISLPQILVLECASEMSEEGTMKENPWTLLDSLCFKEPDTNEEFVFRLTAFTSFSQSASHFRTHFTMNGIVYRHDGRENGGRSVPQPYNSLAEAIEKEGGDWRLTLAIYRLDGGAEKQDAFAKGVRRRFNKMLGHTDDIHSDSDLIKMLNGHTHSLDGETVIFSPDAWKAYRSPDRPPFDYIEFDKTIDPPPTTALTVHAVGTITKARRSVRLKKSADTGPIEISSSPEPEVVNSAGSAMYSERTSPEEMSRKPLARPYRRKKPTGSRTNNK
jgi:hypothetical protein